jgi:hypothetical protein
LQGRKEEKNEKEEKNFKRRKKGKRVLPQAQKHGESGEIFMGRAVSHEVPKPRNHEGSAPAGCLPSCED